MSPRRLLPDASVPEGMGQVLSGALGDYGERVTALHSSLPKMLQENPCSPSVRMAPLGWGTQLASPLEIAAEHAMKPECRPMSLTKPMPLRALRASVCPRKWRRLLLPRKPFHAHEALVHIEHIVVDSLRHPDNSERVPAPHGLLADSAPATLRPVASDHQKNIYLQLNEPVHHAGGVLGDHAMCPGPCRQSDECW